MRKYKTNSYWRNLYSIPDQHFSRSSETREAWESASGQRKQRSYMTTKCNGFVCLFVCLFVFIYFNWRLITLQYCSGFCHTLTWVSHGFTCVPHPESLLASSSPSHPSRSSQCTSPEHPVSCIKPGLVICFTYNYMFQCYSLKSSHPHLFPQSPKDCSLHLCLFCCLSYRLIVTIFLNSIYMC